MYRGSRNSLIGLLLVFLAVVRPVAAAEENPVTGPVWHDDYTKAYLEAAAGGKMLLLVFHDPKPTPADQRFRRHVLTDDSIVRLLADYVCADLATDAHVVSGGQSRAVLGEPALAPLDGKRGIAVVDLAHAGQPYFEKVVSAMPLSGQSGLSVAQTAALLSLPPGTAEDRAAQYAQHMEQLVAAPDPEPAEPETVESSPSEPAASVAERSPLHWITDYAEAYYTAERQHKMLFILFAKPAPESLAGRYAREILSNPTVREKLAHYVIAKLPLDAEVCVDGKFVRAFEQEAFSEMMGCQGVAVIDFAHTDSVEYGSVVSTFPFLHDRLYTEEQTLVMLDLPPGTLTQRTLIYAVRTHPEHPASTNGKLEPNLAAEAANHSNYQARIRLQGHHDWDRRFHRLNRLLPRGLMAREVCAESWPGQRLLEAAIECVRCWRYSSAHWGAVRANKPYYGYDMKLGSNGVWYATGLFADEGD